MLSYNYVILCVYVYVCNMCKFYEVYVICLNFIYNEVNSD